MLHLPQEERLACGRAKLLLAKYSEEAATLDGSTIKQYYRDACEMNRQWEDGHFHLAMYYDRILSSLEKKEKPVEWIHHIILRFVCNSPWYSGSLITFHQLFAPGKNLQFMIVKSVIVGMGRGNYVGIIIVNEMRIESVI